MSYEAGIGWPGAESHGPQITCDTCGTVLHIRTDRPAPAWLLDGRAAPRWRLERAGERRIDTCPRCRAKE